MRTSELLAIGLVSIVLISCGNFTGDVTFAPPDEFGNNSPNPGVPGDSDDTAPTEDIPPPPPPAPLSGSYCVPVHTFSASLKGASISMKCYQADGSWVAMGGDIDTLASCGHSAGQSYGYPQSALNSDQDIVIVLDRCPGYNERHLIVKRYSPAFGWTALSTDPVNLESSPSTLMPMYTQFGPEVTIFNGKPYVLWSQTTKAMLSVLTAAGTWDHVQIAHGNTLIRHPSFFHSGDRLFVFYGEPAPIVWELVGSAVLSTGSIDASPDQYSLYSDVTMWDGHLVAAWTESTYKTTRSWYTAIDTIRVAFHDGHAWITHPHPIQDTPSHDGIRPFLFVIGDELFIMYPDYTTTGVPPSYTRMRELKFRFRVKRWTGQSWVLAAPTTFESPTLILAQRFEYLLRNNQVFVVAHREASDGSIEKIALRWSNGHFVQLGDPIHVYATGSPYSASRPGQLIPLDSGLVEAFSTAFATP